MAALSLPKLIQNPIPEPSSSFNWIIAAQLPHWPLSFSWSFLQSVLYEEPEGSFKSSEFVILFFSVLISSFPSDSVQKALSQWPCYLASHCCSDFISNYSSLPFPLQPYHSYFTLVCQTLSCHRTFVPPVLFARVFFPQVSAHLALCILQISIEILPSKWKLCWLPVP